MQKNSFQSNTQFAFIISKLFNSPLGVMYGLLAFILCKNFNATPFEIAVLISSKPLVAIISFYSVLIINDRPHNLKKLIIWSTILGCLPCLFFPFFSHVWFYIFSSALFMMANRAALPAWSEIFKLNISSEVRGKIFSQGSSINYIANIAIPLIVAPLMDYYFVSWEWIFCILAILQIIQVLAIFSLNINHSGESFNSLKKDYKDFSLKNVLIGPWKNSWILVKQRADFRSYLIAFFLGGSGLILVQPVLPIFFEKVLQLSYTQLALAISVCKGIGFILVSPFWARLFNRISIHLFNFYVTLFAAIFGLILVGMGQQVEYIYLAFFVYGVMQAGSELSWHLSGVIFSKCEDSTLFTGVNVAMVGLRGCIIPFLGEVLYLFNGTFTVFLVSVLFCLAGAGYSLMSDLKARKLIESDQLIGVND
ncbi:MAG: MFS transporter [Parachlamydiaceae bacterium]|nr:MFS transporter [Parachlamydiaceae bacterium]